MIPKTIHYCWFGRGKLPEAAQKCIDSWRKYCPDYEIKEWNEDNFDLDRYAYTAEAYAMRKYAFVTDVVRLYALYTEGGIYMDTDVEVIKPLDPFLHHVGFSGYQDEHTVPTGIMACERGARWAKDNLDYYESRHFVKPDGTADITTNVETITAYMKHLGLRCDNTYQDFPGLFTIYPRTYFCPYGFDKTTVDMTENTVTIHHFAGSWVPRSQQLEAKFWRALGLTPHRVLWHVGNRLEALRHRFAPKASTAKQNKPKA